MLIPRNPPIPVPCTWVPEGPAPSISLSAGWRIAPWEEYSPWLIYRPRTGRGYGLKYAMEYCCACKEMPYRSHQAPTVTDPYDGMQLKIYNEGTVKTFLELRPDLFPA